jgi:hypothetical protein
VGSWLEYRLKVNAQNPKLDSKCYLRTGHTATLGGSRLFVFGGTLMATGQKTAELLVMNLDRMEWQRVEQVRFCRYRFCATGELKYRGAVW